MVGRYLDRRELGFLAAAAAATALFAVLAWQDAAPLRPPEGEAAAVRAESSLLEAAQVDLNTAGLDALCTLPGVGEKRARAILADRAANGPYAQVEDVTRVSGITQNTIRDWARLAYVSGPGPEGE